MGEPAGGKVRGEVPAEDFKIASEQYLLIVNLTPKGGGWKILESPIPKILQFVKLAVKVEHAQSGPHMSRD